MCPVEKKFVSPQDTTQGGVKKTFIENVTFTRVVTRTLKKINFTAKKGGEHD